MKLDTILESVREDYLMKVLEEGTTTELDTLRTKKFLRESTQEIRKILIQEGVMDSVKNHLQNNWKTYAGAAGAAGLAMNPDVQSSVNDAATITGDMVGNAGQALGSHATNAYNAVGDAISGNRPFEGTNSEQMATGLTRGQTDSNTSAIADYMKKGGIPADQIAQKLAGYGPQAYAQ